MSTFERRISREELGDKATGYLNLYLFFQLAPGHFLLPLMLLTFLFSKTAVRHATLLNVIIIFILSDIISSFLLYAGKTVGPEPSKTLCTAQLSLLNGATAAWPVAIFMLVLNMWGTFKNAKTITHNRIVQRLMLVAPYVTMLVWTIIAAVLAANMPERVSRDRRFFYCSLHYDPYSDVEELIAAVVLLVTLGFEIHLAVILSRNWHALRQAGMSSGIDVFFIIRIFIFGLYILIGFIVTVIMIWSPTSVLPDMFAASVGLSVFLVFGTQRDTLRVWCFWRRESPTPVKEPKTFEIDAYRPSYDKSSMISSGSVLDIGREQKPVSIV